MPLITQRSLIKILGMPRIEPGLLGEKHECYLCAMHPHPSYLTQKLYQFKNIHDDWICKSVKLWVIFFTPISRSYTSLLLDGGARNYFYLPGYARITQLIVSGSIYSYLLCSRREEKTIWTELELNKGPLASNIHKRPLWPLDHGQLLGQLWMR